MAKQRPRVLIVDDEPNIGAIIRALLRSQPWDVMVVSNGDDALKVLLTDVHFDVVALDLMMPGDNNGMDVYYRLEKDAPERIKHVVVITGGGIPAIERFLTETGCDYVLKPFGEEIISIFDAIIRRTSMPNGH
jgi:two-component system OmpR family response regulator